VLVNRLCEGQHATVLQLPASTHAPSEAEEQEPSSVRENSSVVA
jgi:hypothetical protein